MVKYVEGSWDEDYIQTLGVNFMEKTISIRNTEITFSIWDLGGQREFVNMLPLVCNDAVAILFMFDLTRKSTLNSIKEWYRQGRGFNKTAIPFLVGTKYDHFVNFPREEQEEISNQARRFAKAMKASLIFSSTSHSINVQKAGPHESSAFHAFQSDILHLSSPLTAVRQRSSNLNLIVDHPDYEVVGGAQKLEEEAFEDYQTGKYYPVRIGDVLASKYQVVGKLGFGVSSTVWLARDLILHRHVTLKVFTRDHQNDGEIEMYEHLMKGNPSHPGKRFVRTFLESFTIPRAGGSHHCLVHTPLWGSLRDMIARNPYRDRFNEELLRETLYRLFQALDYLHTDRKIIHTGLR
ncbi:hypothetical protein B0A49_12729, partial [Cryomyces minteri]